MHKLEEIAKKGTTIFITAHTVSNLYLCDKIIFMGTGGNICHIGNYQESLNYFGVKEFVDIYDILKDNTELWTKKYQKEKHQSIKTKKISMKQQTKKSGFFHQLNILIQRNLKLKWNNKFLLCVLILQAPIMAIAIFAATGRDAFSSYQSAKIILLVFTCAATWLGMFNSVQEISREFLISKKEYMSNLNFSSYIVSKVAVLAMVCFLQMVLLMGINFLLIDFPTEGIFLKSSFLEFLLQYFLISFSAGSMGIFISSIVDRTETTMVVLPIYMMFQLLFTGVIIPLNNLAEKISYLMTARWGMAGFGIIANLEKIANQNSLLGVANIYAQEVKDLFPFDIGYLWFTWSILIVVTVLFLYLSIICIKKRLKKDF